MPHTPSPANWEQVKELFHQAVELPTGEREAFLEARCGEDAVLRDAVAGLLRADDEGPTLLEHSPLAFVRDGLATEGGAAPRRIGPYVILRELGSGGMGTVYEATRDDEQFRQRVAVKLVRRGLDSDPDILRRFHNERQILASLNHPNIARLFDGGATEDGRPYFAMEYVDGKPVDEYCEAAGLDTAARLRLFRTVCAAVSYAHQNLVVHRDLKPSNIVVTADGTVKLLDFGIAKLLRPDEDPSATQTATQLGAMTPAYASPEQVRGLRATTASDVYSLGVVLYELLTGRRPYEFDGRRADEMARVVCEVEPQRPSALAAETTERDVRRSTRPAGPSLRRRLRGDVDNIVLLALRKDPARRYSSAELLSEDIRRHLDGLPVSARADTFTYRVSKFVERNRASTIAAALVLLTLVVGVVGMSWEAVRAERERARAEKRFAQVRQLANNVVFKYYDEIEKLPGSTKAREILVADALEYLDGLAQDAKENTDLRRELAAAYLRIGKVQGRAYNANLGDTSGAVGSYRKGISLLEPIALGPADTKSQADLVGAYSELSTALRRQGSTAEADASLRRALSLNEQFHAAHPEDVTLSVRLATNYVFLGDTLPVGEGEKESIGAFRRSLAVSEEALRREPDHVRANNLLAVALDRIETHLLNLARNAEEDDDPARAKLLREEAEPYVRRTIEVSEKLVRLQPDDVVNDRILKSAKANSAQYLFESGRFEEAGRVLAEAVADFSEFARADPDNQEQKLDLAIMCSWEGANYSRLGLKAQAAAAFSRSFRILDELVAHDPQNLESIQKRLEVEYRYADEQLAAGDAEAARRAYQRAFERAEPVASAKDASFGESLRGYFFEKIGNCESAIARKGSTPEARRAREAASVSYQNAVDLWRQYGPQSSPGVADEGRAEIVEKKLRRIRSGDYP
ncbi:MAG: protein kinase [Acidobacteria bacterium]|nr:protein kinase [Acidobacteriota bacterium]